MMPERSVPIIDWGRGFARSSEEAFIVRVINLAAWLGVVLQFGVGFARLSQGETVHLVRTLVPQLVVLVGVVLLQASGRLLLARRVFAYGVPAVVALQAGLGVAAQGQGVALVICAIAPITFGEWGQLERPGRLVVPVALGAFAAVYVGQSWPLIHAGRAEAAAAARLVMSVGVITVGALLCAVLAARLREGSAELARAWDEHRRVRESRERLLKGLGSELRRNSGRALEALATIDPKRLPEAARPLLEDARRAATREAQVQRDLRELVAFAEARDGAEQPFSLRAAVEAAVGDARRAATERGLEFRLRIEGEDQRWGLEPAWRTLVRQLVDNAVRYTREGGVEVRVTAEDENVCLWVGDTGPGIPEELRQRVFAAFEQGSSGDARSAQGLGIGLTLARAASARLQGGLELGSEGERGTRVEARVRLPRVSP